MSMCALIMEAQEFSVVAVQHSSHAEQLQLVAMAQAVLWSHQRFPAGQMLLLTSNWGKKKQRAIQISQCWSPMQ